MIVFLESPMPWIFLGIVLEGILGVVFFTNRRGAVLLAMVGVLLVVGGGARGPAVRCDRTKRVRTMLDSAVAAIQANDADRAEQFLAQSANDTLKRLRYYMGLVEFEEIHISNVQIEINRLTSPPTADVRLWGMAKFHDRLGISPYPPTHRGIRLCWSRSPTAGKSKTFGEIRRTRCEVGRQSRTGA